MSIEFMSFLIGLLVILIVMFVQSLLEADKIYLTERIQVRSDNNGSSYKPSQSAFGKFYKRHIEPSFGRHFEQISLLLGLDMDLLQSRIELSGKKEQVSAIEIVVLKVLGVAFLILVGAPSLLSGDMMVSMIVVALFVSLYFLPESKIKTSIKDREKNILDELPTFIEQVYLCIEAGANLKAALEIVSEKMGGILGKAFGEALIMEVYSGSWEKELISMCEQMHVEALEDFVTDILNANEKGISIVETLRNEVKHINVVNRSRVRETTNKLESSMTIHMMVYFFLPTLVIIMLPIMMQVLESLG